VKSRKLRGTPRSSTVKRTKLDAVSHCNQPMMRTAVFTTTNCTVKLIEKYSASVQFENHTSENARKSLVMIMISLPMNETIGLVDSQSSALHSFCAFPLNV